MMFIWFLILAVCVLVVTCLISLYPCFFGHGVSKNSRILASVASVVIIVLSCGVYVLLGQPITVMQPWLAEHVGQEQFARLIAHAKTKLQNDGDNVEGWVMLARGQMMLEDYASAIESLEEARRLDPDNFAILLGLADARIMENGGQVHDGELALLKSAYSIHPLHQSVLWLLAIAYEQRNDNVAALRYWHSLASVLEQQPELLAEVQKRIARLTGDNDFGYLVTLSIDPSLRFSPTKHSVVFVFASAVNGSSMPVAALRLPVDDLPTTVRLGDKASLSSTRLLSSLDQVVLTARISLSGAPTAQEGDVFGRILLNKTDAEDRQQLVINQIEKD